MSLHIHRHKKVVPNEAEELQALAFEAVKDQMNVLINKGWKFDVSGRVKGAMLNYKGVWIFHLMIHLAYNMREELGRLGKKGEKCNASALADKYKLDCIEDNLSCLSKTYGTDYVTAWDAILAVYGISRATENCEDCCLGIGSMIIEGDDECTAFIIGDCDSLNQTPRGEFAPCEFEATEFTEPRGDNIYITCG